MATLANPFPSHPFLSALHLTHATVESGVPTATIAAFAEASGIPLKDVLDVVIPARTLKHRNARREPLSRDESDKLARLVRVFDHAVSVFAGPDLALAWLTRPRKRFSNRSPLTMLRTEIGGNMVDEALTQIDEGMFA